ncbi:serine/threonine-protein phosphatase 7 long form homolog [Arachis stenosperma]|uniref:serine/threonine-protein phosphatase 7 long form homolog n=1 Tax=Arachis stenosperma TaxID=217475 RepID=UPI0025ACF9E9|nr:serine/threonine-protein phosphatase 7 long form homolog [Arachis stenosperma]
MTTLIDKCRAVSRRTNSSFAHLVDKCVANFGILSDENDHVSSAIKLSWIRQIRDAEALDTPESMQRYVRCHIFCLIGTTLFPNKSTSLVSYKYLPLLRNFVEISSYSWGSACLAYLYKSLCRASNYDTKDMDGPLVLLHVWTWERMPWLAPIPAGGVFSLARR